MWLTRLQDSIFNQEIEMASYSSGSQAKALTDDHSRRRPILKNGACDSVASAEVIDFHNSIVS
jgi:hypothetical protein